MAESILNLTIFVALMMGTPGPANLLVMIGGASYGLKNCLPFILGLNTGTLILNVLIGFGFALIIHDSPTLQLSLKIIGGAYMLFLSLQAWFSPAENNPNLKPQFTFLQGVMVPPLNPKAWVMLTIAWVEYGSGLGSFAMQLLIIVSIFFGVQVVSHISWCYLGSLLKSSFKNSVWLKRSMIILTMAVVLWALLL